jgi:cytoskeleton protein RodZ
VSEADVLPGFSDIGARLRRARERAGMTVAQAAERLHCGRGLIESMEAGRFAQIGAPVFVRGHLRRYTELVGEPVGEVLELWEREAAGHVAAPDITRIPKAKRSPDTRRLLLPVAVAALVALFAVLISWVLRDSPLPEIGGFAAAPVAEAPAEGAAADAGITPAGEQAGGEAAGPATAADGLPAGADAAPGESPDAQVPGGESAALPATATGAVATGAARAAPPQSAGALRIRATADCWIEVYDAERGRLYFNLLKAGSSTTVRGRMPLRLLLGNVRGVALTFDGRELRVPAELQRANTANVLLGADGALRAAPRD